MAGKAGLRLAPAAASAVMCMSSKEGGSILQPGQSHLQGWEASIVAWREVEASSKKPIDFV